MAKTQISSDTIKNNSITGAKVGDEFTTADALTQSAGTVNIDWEDAQVFTFTATENITLNMQNVIVGVSKAIVITGEGASNTLSFNIEGAAGTFNKISGDYDDTSSTKNFIQVTCVGATEFWYTISQIDS
mgnify:CR=1 FL=1